MKQKIDGQALIQPGRFVLGCNYWASHAGTAMWNDWRADVVARDFKKLAQGGLQVLRVFPIWSVFQPIHLLRTGGEVPVEYRFGEEPLPDTEAGCAGVSEEAMRHFEEFAALARQNKLGLIVGIVTGFMSGRNFTPPALVGLDLHQDAVALKWQIRFTRYFVKHFRDNPAIIAWDLGNECNNLGGATTSEKAWLWTASITNAIRVEDQTRPVVSGMHSSRIDGVWRIDDQGELNDVVTTHPYPVFTPHCNLDPLNTMRTMLHAAAQTRWYADISGKPCFAEEFGQLGPMVSSDKVAADFARIVMFSLWANDCHGALWWCANEQTELPRTPYAWYQMEQELGLFYQSGKPKPVFQENGKFRKLLDRLPFAALPPVRRRAVCINTRDQDDWGVAYSAFLLSVQAGFDLSFQSAAQPLRDASVYMLPSLKGHRPLRRDRWLDLLSRVRAGATLYISLDGGFLTHFEEVTGVQVQTRAAPGKGAGMKEMTLAGVPDGVLHFNAEVEYVMRANRAKVLGAGPDGNPAFTCAAYGKGRVFLLAYPLEEMLCNSPDVFHADGKDPYWRIYAQIGESLIRTRVARKSSAMVGLTEHEMNGSERIIVLINYSTADCRESVQLKAGWRLGRVIHGARPAAGPGGLVCALPHHDACVFSVRRS